jgi:hypothetical protein
MHANANEVSFRVAVSDHEDRVARPLTLAPQNEVQNHGQKTPFVAHDLQTPEMASSSRSGRLQIKLVERLAHKVERFL